MEKIKLVIADDHHILLDGLKSLLEPNEDMEILGLFDNGPALLEAAPTLLPHIALVDINMPGMNGQELTQKIKKDHPYISVIVLSMHDDVEHITELIEAGASGYLLKNVNDQELVEAIRNVAAGKMYFCNEVTEKLTNYAVEAQRKKDAPPEPKLTARELEVLKLVAEEMTNAQIADTLFISERTVETHRKNMLRKTENKTMVGLMKFAMEKKLI